VLSNGTTHRHPTTATHTATVKNPHFVTFSPKNLQNSRLFSNLPISLNTARILLIFVSIDASPSPLSNGTTHCHPTTATRPTTADHPHSAHIFQKKILFSAHFSNLCISINNARMAIILTPIDASPSPLSNGTTHHHPTTATLPATADHPHSAPIFQKNLKNSKNLDLSSTLCISINNARVSK
jgi:hypothetical protein